MIRLGIVDFDTSHVVQFSKRLLHKGIDQEQWVEGAEIVCGCPGTSAICEQEKDFETREILEVLLDDTEMDHAYWLEQQLGLIEKVGLQNYLQSQM